MISTTLFLAFSILTSCSSKKILAAGCDGTTEKVTVEMSENKEFKGLTCSKAQITLGSSYTSIQSEYFKGTTLKSLTIPFSVTNIYSGAFESANIQTLTLENSITSGDNLFRYSTIDTLVISQSNIPSDVFTKANSFGTVSFPQSLSSIGSSAFSSCYIGTLDFSKCSNYGKLNDHSLSQISSLKAIRFGSINSVGQYAFQESYITDIDLTGTSITEIDQYAFANIKSLHKLTISKDVTSIGSNAFQNSIITELDISKATSLQTIGADAFNGGKIESKVVFLPTLESIGDRAFKDCRVLEEVDLSGATALETIGEEAFMGTSLKVVKFSNGASLKYIGDSAFKDIISLTETGSTLIKARAINKNAFSGCINLVASIEITPSSSSNDFYTASIGHSAFFNCYKIENLNMQEFGEFNSIGKSAFRNSGIQAITFPKIFSSISQNAFRNCSRLTGSPEGSLVIESIGFYAFQYDDKFQVSKIQTKAVGQQAFEYCRSLKAEIIIDSEGSISSNAFAYCGGLQSLQLTPQENDYLETTDKNDNSVLTRQSIGSGAFYRSSLGGDLVIPLTFTSIGSEAFAYCNLKSISINGSDTIPQTISSKAFYRAAPLQAANKFDLDLPFSVVDVGDYAFAHCPIETLSIYGTTLSHNVQGDYYTSTTIGKNAFESCSLMKTLTFDGFDILFDRTSFRGCQIESLSLGNIEVIPDYAFYEMATIKGDVIIPDSVTYIGSRAFAGCTEISSIDLSNQTRYVFQNNPNDDNTPSTPSTVSKSIGFGAFDGCTNLGSAKIPYGVTAIPSRCFYKCTKLSSVEIPNTVTSIQSYAFYQCSGLNMKIELPDELTEIQQHAFYGCKSLKGPLTFPNTVETIANSAFAECSGISGKLTLPKPSTKFVRYGDNNEPIYESTSLTIGPNAFSGCSSLSNELTIPDHCSQLGIGAFRSCSGLSGKLTIPDSMSTIPNYAFYDCSKLTGEIPTKGKTSIGPYAFYNCAGFTGDLNLLSHGPTINAYSFYNCAGLNGQLLLPISLSNVNQYAFYGCSGLTGEIDCRSVQNVYKYAFAKCSGLTGPLVFEQPKSIKEYAFAECSGFSDTLSFLVNELDIGQCAFKGCSGFNKGTLRFTMNNYEESDGTNSYYSPSYTYPYFLKIDNNAFEDTKFNDIYYLGRFTPDCGYDSGLSKAKHIYTSSNFANKTFCGKTVKGKGGLSGGAIAGIVIAVIVVVALIVFLVIFFLKKKGKDNSEGEVEMNNTP